MGGAYLSGHLEFAFTPGNGENWMTFGGRGGTIYTRKMIRYENRNNKKKYTKVYRMSRKKNDFRG